MLTLDVDIDADADIGAAAWKRAGRASRIASARRIGTWTSWVTSINNYTTLTVFLHAHGLWISIITGTYFVCNDGYHVNMKHGYTLTRQLILIRGTLQSDSLVKHQPCRNLKRNIAAGVAQ